MSALPSSTPPTGSAGKSDCPTRDGSAWIFLVALGNLVMSVFLTMAALLKETPLFWRHAGGYPVVLRELLLAFFYPAWLVSLLLSFASNWLAWRLFRHGRLVGLVIFALGILTWIFLALVTGIVLWNNLENVREGRPWHWHPF